MKYLAALFFATASVRSPPVNIETTIHDVAALARECNAGVPMPFINTQEQYPLFATHYQVPALTQTGFLVDYVDNSSESTATHTPFANVSDNRVGPNDTLYVYIGDNEDATLLDAAAFILTREGVLMQTRNGQFQDPNSEAVRQILQETRDRLRNQCNSGTNNLYCS